MTAALRDATLFGLDEEHIDRDSLTAPVHRAMVEAFVALQTEARAAGFELAIASGFRSFSRQMSIWNDKAQGMRPVFDVNGEQLDITTLSDWEKAQAILRWSALPGLSRHHWGSDVDVYDLAAVPADYRVQLSVEEVSEDGPFAPMHQWLDSWIAQTGDAVFFRPYASDLGGVSPEKWHLSYAPLSLQFEKRFSISHFRQLLDDQPLALKQVVLDNLEHIVERFFHRHCKSMATQ